MDHSLIEKLCATLASLQSLNGLLTVSLKIQNCLYDNSNSIILINHHFYYGSIWIIPIDI